MRPRALDPGIGKSVHVRFIGYPRGTAVTVDSVTTGAGRRRRGANEGDQRDPHGRVSRSCRWSKAARAFPSPTASRPATGRRPAASARSAPSTPTASTTQGRRIPQLYHGRTRRERHEELVAYAIRGALTQARRAYELAGGKGRIHANILWEMGGAERIITDVLEQAKGLINGITCGAGMPYRLSDIAARFNVYYYPIISSARAFNALWKRAYHKAASLLGGVVYEDPWLAGGHNGLSNGEDPTRPEDPFPRVLALRKLMREFGLHDTPIIMAGGVWWLEEWEDWIDNPELGPIAFQFGTRPLLTKESPIGEAWKERLLTLKEGDVFLNRFSPTGFYSSAVNNGFIQELRERSERQVAYTTEPVGEHVAEYGVGPRKRLVYLTPADLERARAWEAQGFTEALRTPDSTLVFVTPEKAKEILADQAACMGCLSPAGSPTGRSTRRTIPPASAPIRAASASRRRCRTSRMRRMSRARWTTI